MSQLKSLCIFVSLFLTLAACNKKEMVSNCAFAASINKAKFDQSSPPAFDGISNVRIDGDCLHMTLTESGCDGISWTIEIIDSGDIAESLPVQRFIKVFVTHEELCPSIIERDISIDISALKLENESSAFLNIENYPDQILFEF